MQGVINMGAAKPRRHVQPIGRSRALGSHDFNQLEHQELRLTYGAT